MDYSVNSLKEAISISLHKHDDFSYINIKKLILYGLNEDYHLFTISNNCQNYVSSIGKEGILNELNSVVNEETNSLEELIDKYINKAFTIDQNYYTKTNSYKNTVDFLEEKSDLDKILKKIRYFNTISESDEEFNNNVWDYFEKVFMGDDKDISSKELRYDMICAALRLCHMSYEDLSSLKEIEIKNNYIQPMDAIIFVGKYVYENKLDELFKEVSTNSVLSGTLLQNLLNYIYFKKDLDDNNLNSLDYELEKLNSDKEKVNTILKIINGEKVDYIDYSKEEIIIHLLKNTLCMYIYSNNKNSIDYDEKKLYEGNNKVSEDAIYERKSSNNKIANNLIMNGYDIDELTNIIKNIDDKTYYFLANIYVLSRALKDNVKKIDKAIYYGSEDQLKIYRMLNEKELVMKLKQNSKTK